MNVSPFAKKTTLRGTQRTPRSLLDALYARQHFHHVRVPRGLALAANLDTTVQTPRADVDAAIVPTST